MDASCICARRGASCKNLPPAMSIPLPNTSRKEVRTWRVKVSRASEPSGASIWDGEQTLLVLLPHDEHLQRLGRRWGHGGGGGSRADKRPSSESRGRRGDTPARVRVWLSGYIPPYVAPTLHADAIVQVADSNEVPLNPQGQTGGWTPRDICKPKQRRHLRYQRCRYASV